MKLSEIIQAATKLQEYEKKQLAIVLMSQTLTPLTVDKTMDIIKPDPLPYDIKINWADGSTTYKDSTGQTVTETIPTDNDTATDLKALDEALRYF